MSEWNFNQALQDYNRMLQDLLTRRPQSVGSTDDTPTFDLFSQFKAGQAKAAAAELTD